MAEHKVADGAVGVSEITLAPGVEEVVVYAENLAAVEVFSNGTAAVYFTVDGEAPTVKGADCWTLPEGSEKAREVESKKNQGTVVRLISAGSPTVNVGKVSN